MRDYGRTDSRWLLLYVEFISGALVVNINLAAKQRTKCTRRQAGSLCQRISMFSAETRYVIIMQVKASQGDIQTQTYTNVTHKDRLF
jgi:hypothetical protein